jgi:hypothetical protein
MSNSTQDVHDDIAFMRALAEDGRAGPLFGGSILFAGGFLFGLTSLTVWAALRGLIPGGQNIHILWFIAALLFFVALFFLKSRIPARGGSSRSAGQAWSALGWASSAIIVSLLVMGFRSRDPLLGEAIAPVMLGIYGAGWAVASMMTQQRWLMGVALGAFAMALTIAWFATDMALVYLLYGIGLLLLGALPGLILMRQARRAA